MDSQSNEAFTDCVCNSGELWIPGFSWMGFCRGAMMKQMSAFNESISYDLQE